MSDAQRMFIQQIKDRHDPEYDLSSDGPDVTWAEAFLADAVLELMDDNAALKKKVNELAAVLDAAYS